MGRVVLALAAAVTGALVAGPLLSHAVLRWLGRQEWIGWQGAVPRRLSAPEHDAVASANQENVAGPADEGAEVGSAHKGAEVGAAEQGVGGGRPPRPVCPECGASLALWGLPVVPWLAVRGRCRSCRAPVGRWVLGVEVATGAGFGVAAARFGWSVELPPVLVLVAGLVAVSTVDIVCRRIPTRFVHVTTAAAAAAIGLAVLVDGEPASLVGAAVGAVVAAAMLGLSHLLIEVVLGKPFGLGDVRLGTSIGLVAGWLGSLNWIEWGHEHLVDGETDMVLVVLGASGAALLSLIVGTFAGSIVGLVRRFALGRPQPFPLGPWLALGGLAAVLVI